LVLFAMVLMVVIQAYELDKSRLKEAKVNSSSQIPDSKQFD
jgi:hypothetical protein